MLPRKTTYTEYHRLIANSKVTVAIFFGAADYDDEVAHWDWGMVNYREFARALRNRRFRKTQDLEPSLPFPC